MRGKDMEYYEIWQTFFGDLGFFVVFLSRLFYLKKGYENQKRSLFQ